MAALADLMLRVFQTIQQHVSVAVILKMLKSEVVVQVLLIPIELLALLEQRVYRVCAYQKRN